MSTPRIACKLIATATAVLLASPAHVAGLAYKLDTSFKPQWPAGAHTFSGVGFGAFEKLVYVCAAHHPRLCAMRHPACALSAGAGAPPQ